MARQYVSAISPNYIWNLKACEPDLWAALSAYDAWAADTYGALERSLPVATTCAPFSTETHERGATHVRSFCIKGSEKGSVFIKGSELLAKDTVDLCHLAAQVRTRDPHPPYQRISLLTLAERFPIMEQKVPGVVLQREAEDEVRAAAAVQVAHLRRYKVLAKLPVPLFVHRFEEEEVAAFVSELAAILPTRAADLSKTLARDGLACVVYFYPGSGFRISTLAMEQPELENSMACRTSYAARAEVTKRVLPVREVAEAWLELVARVLSVGFFPNNPFGNYLQGEAVQWQNMVSDGGVVDADSFTSMAEVSSSTRFAETYWALVIELATTLRKLLLGEIAYPTREYPDPSPVMAMLVSQVHTQLRALVLDEHQKQAVSDLRLLEALGSEDWFDNLHKTLEKMFPPYNLRGGDILMHYAAG